MTRDTSKPASVDVLAMMDAIIRRHESAARAYRAPVGKPNHHANDAAKMREARDAVAELIEAANAIFAKRGGLMALGANDARARAARRITVRFAEALARVSSGSADA